MELKKDIFRIGLVILGIVVLSFVLTAFFSVHARRILSAMMVAVGLVSFYGFISLGVSAKDRNLSKIDIRLATVVSIITFYLVLVGTVSQFAPRTGGTNAPEITTTLLNHFTTIVGVVIAFYFGSEAYMTAQNRSSKPSNDGEGPSGEHQDQE